MRWGPEDPTGHLLSLCNALLGWEMHRGQDLGLLSAAEGLGSLKYWVYIQQNNQLDLPSPLFLPPLLIPLISG